MLTGYYSGVSGLYYNEQKLGVTSNNLANSNTSGFRRSLMVLRSREENPYTRQIDPMVKERLPDTYGIQRTGVYKSMDEAGALKHTGNDFHVAIVPEQKNAFFAVRKNDPNDPQLYYSRSGNLSFGPLNPNQPDGPKVLLAGGHRLVDQGGNPIQIDPENGPLRIGDDGVIYQNDEEQGQIAVFRLNKSADPTVQQSANLQLLEQMGEGLFRVPEGKEGEFYPSQLQVGQAGISRLMKQGTQEASNVNVYHELMEMMNANRSYGANVRAMNQQFDGLDKLFQMIRS